MRLLGTALFCIAVTEAAIRDFTVQGGHCNTGLCQTAATAGAAVTAEQINACLNAAPAGCTYTSTYTASGALPVCSTTAVTWLEEGPVYGVILDTLKPIVNGTLTTASGSITFTSTLTAGVAAPDTCQLRYALANIGADTCSGVTNIADPTRTQSVQYSNGSATVTLTPALLGSLLTSDVQFQVQTPTLCGTNWNVQAVDGVYSFTHTIPGASGAFPKMQGLIAGLALLGVTAF